MESYDGLVLLTIKKSPMVVQVHIAHDLYHEIEKNLIAWQQSGSIDNFSSDVIDIHDREDFQLLLNAFFFSENEDEYTLSPEKILAAVH